jgi:hypothetical protein
MCQRTALVTLPRWEAPNGLADRGTKCDHGALDVPSDQLRFQAEDSVAQAPKLFVPTAVCRATLPMAATIYFHDEPNRRGAEVHDEVLAEHHLPAEGHTESASAKDLPEVLFRRCRRVQHEP